MPCRALCAPTSLAQAVQSGNVSSATRTLAGEEIVCACLQLEQALSRHHLSYTGSLTMRAALLVDCYMVAGGLMKKDEDGFSVVRRGSIDEMHAAKVFAFAQVRPCPALPSNLDRSFVVLPPLVTLLA